jgi:ABC-type glycerol-3-phosphate transport system substrate-binding protein
MPRFGIAAVSAAMVAGLTLAACSSSGGGGNDSTPPSSPSSAPSAPSSSVSASFDRTAAQAEIKKNWEAFFSKDTPLAKKVDYIEHGDQLKTTVQKFGSDPRLKQASAKVTDVFASSPTAATVKYQVLLNGKVALPSAVGDAVYENGVWKVSDKTLCGLLGLIGGPKVAGCS